VKLGKEMWRKQILNWPDLILFDISYIFSFNLMENKNQVLILL